jgi:hypothetical protein
MEGRDLVPKGQFGGLMRFRREMDHLFDRFFDRRKKSTPKKIEIKAG